MILIDENHDNNRFLLVSSALFPNRGSVVSTMMKIPPYFRGCLKCERAMKSVGGGVLKF